MVGWLVEGRGMEAVGGGGWKAQGEFGWRVLTFSVCATHADELPLMLLMDAPEERKKQREIKGGRREEDVTEGSREAGRGRR